MGCESCGSHDIYQTKDEIICRECGFTRERMKLKKLKRIDRLTDNIFLG